MSLETELLKENSRYNVDRIVKIVEVEPKLFNELVKISLSGNVVLAMRASWALTHCYDVMPELLKPHVPGLIAALPGFPHTGIRRSVLRMLSFEKIPKELQGVLYNICYNLIRSKKEPVAVKVHALEILTNIALEEPDLKNEVVPLILDFLPHGSMAFKSRGSKVLRKLGVNMEDINF